jgi:hypothetical protein
MLGRPLKFFPGIKKRRSESAFFVENPGSKDRANSPYVRHVMCEEAAIIELIKGYSTLGSLRF